jgi:hypothetical protein
MPFTADSILTDEHRSWLDRFSSHHREAWDTLLNQDPEAAMCEAGFRRLLEQNGSSVEPNERIGDRGRKPDFRCVSKSQQFYFETTCVRIETVVRRYNLPPDEVTGPEMRIVRPTPEGPPIKVFREQPITRLFFEECVGKADQCSGMDAPTVLGIGTFHRPAAWVSLETDYVDELLVGSPQFRVPLNPQTGGIAGPAVTLASLNHSFALRYGKSVQEVEHARRSISALVLAYPNRTVFDRVIGVIHPDAVRPFDWNLLPQVNFRTLVVNAAEGWCHAVWAGQEDESE